MSLAELEVALSHLLAPDSAVIRQAEQQLQQPFRDPAIVPALIQLLAASQNAQIRQLASVLVRRLAHKHWDSLSVEVVHEAKAALLVALGQEAVHAVTFNIAQVVGELADSELATDGGWPGLWEFMQGALQCPAVERQELGLMLLCSLSNCAGDKLVEQFKSFAPLFPTCLAVDSVKIPYYALQALAGIAPYVAHLHEAYFRDIIPLCIVAIDRLLAVDEDKGLEGMNVLAEVIESEGNTIGGQLNTLLAFSLKVGADTTRDKGPRCKALSMLLDLIMTKKTKFLKGPNLLTVIQTLFAVMASPMEEEEDDEDEETDLLLGYAPQAVASQVLSNLAIEFTHDVIVDPLMSLVKQNHDNSDPNIRRACLIAITVVADGCSVHLKLNQLQPLMMLVNAGLSDSSRIVHIAALSAMAEFSVHFQPEISKYTAEVLPKLIQLLIHCLDSADFDKSKTKHVFCAFEMFIENNEEDVSAYMQQVMDILMLVLAKTQNTTLRELAIQSLGAVATAIKKTISPFFPQIMEAIKPHLQVPGPSDEPSVILLTCIDTLGVLARSVSKEVFQPLAMDFVKLCSEFISASTDPDLRSVVYGLLGSISMASPDVVAEFLPIFVPILHESLEICDDKSTEEEGFSFSDLNGDGNDANDGLSAVNSPYGIMKEDAANCLATMAEETGAAFLPHFDKTFLLVSELLDDPFVTTNVEKGAITALGRLTVYFHKQLQQNGAQGQGDSGPSAQTASLATTIESAAKLALTTFDRLTAVACLECLKSICNELETAALPSDAHFNLIYETVTDVLNLKAACQATADGDEEDGVTEEKGTEYDHLVVETAGEVLPCLAVAKGPQTFAPFFNGALASILARTGKHCSDAERSFGYGIIAEVLKELETHGQVFGRHLLPVLLAGSNDEDDEVANNAIFGMGLVCQFADADVQDHFPTVLQALAAALQQRQNERRVVDNICSAVCRVIICGVDKLPMDTVLATLLPHLPVQIDFEENYNIYSCLCRLIEMQHSSVRTHLATLVQLFTTLLSNVEQYELNDGSPPLTEIITVGLQRLQQA